MKKSSLFLVFWMILLSLVFVNAEVSEFENGVCCKIYGYGEMMKEVNIEYNFVQEGECNVAEEFVGGNREVVDGKYCGKIEKQEFWRWLMSLFFGDRGEIVVKEEVTEEENSEFYEMTEDDCFEFEKYDADEKACYIECESDEECSELEEEYYGNLSEFEEIYIDEEEYTDYRENLEEELAEDTLVIYEIIGDKLNMEEKPLLKNEDLKIFQEDKEKHELMWYYFVSMFPKQSYEKDLIKYIVYTDGKEESLAFIALDEKDSTKWSLGIDIQDAFVGNEISNKSDLIYNLVHEYGHLLTLNSMQVDLNVDEESCKTLFIDEGCSDENSYLNRFYNNFWKDIYSEWLETTKTEDKEKSSEKLEEFFLKYENHFFTDYAATNIAEDIAESWTAFVLFDKPTGNSIKDKKVLMFYDYPELVELRESVIHKIKVLLKNPEIVRERRVR